MVTLVQDLIRVRDDGTRSLPRKQSKDSYKQLSELPAEACINELFEKEVDRNPDAPAIIFGESQLTYREVNTRANQLARFLRRFGVGPNSLVGLCVHRSPEMIIGILGILKSGAAYVPMDPDDSEERISFIMDDANLFLLLTHSQLLDKLPRHNGPRLSLDSDWDVIAKERKMNPARRASTRNLAYVIYTAATTGFLKGVRISHRGLVNYLSWGAEAYEVVKGCGSIVDSSVPFDLAITRVLAPLMVGRGVILVTEDCYINC
jgi:non-ribosomal peptide synthetase component F